MTFPLLFGRKYLPESHAIFRAMSTPPNKARRKLIDAVIRTAEGEGAWDRVGAIWIFAGADSQAALINWKDPAGAPALAVNSPPFTADRGFVGDGTSAYIDSQKAWSAIPGVTQNDASIGLYARGASTLGSALGVASSAIVRLDSASGQVRSAVNNTAHTADNITFGVATHLIASRSNASTYERYMNGTQLADASAASSAAPSGNLRGLSSNTAFAGSTTRIAAMYAGASLTPAQAAKLHAALSPYMIAVGLT